MMKNVFILLSLLLIAFSARAQNTMANVEIPELGKTTSTIKKPSTKVAISKATMLDHTRQAQIQLAHFAAKEIQYPEDFLDDGFEGQVIVDVWINPQGEITHTKIIESFNNNFNPIVLRAFQNFEFSGPQKIEYFGARRLRLPVDFSLK